MPPPDWAHSITQTIRQHQSRGGFVVIFPEYRPDQFLAMAANLGLANYDYRAEVMSGYGWNADQLTLDDLDNSLAEQAADKGTLISNVEALLSTKSADDRARWITRFLNRNWDHAVVIPIVINALQVPIPHPRVHRVPENALPDQTLINRLSF